MPFHHQARMLRGLTLMALFALLVFAANGCGSREGGSTADQSSTSTDTAATTPDDAPKSEAAGSSAGSSSSESATPAAEAGVVRLVDKGCVQFEPHWVSVASGQTVTWVSELKAPVTVHVDAGAFNKTQFVVRPGARVTSGPAGAARDYKVWTEPNACQGAPLGARGSGPGIEVSAGH